jgi:2-C-methyl-D-erythritol 4-phosphate cytidylyltransferase
MRDLTSTPVVYILIEDETALLQIGKKHVYEISIDQARDSEFKPEVRLFVPEDLYAKNENQFNKDIKIEVFKDFVNYLGHIELPEQIVIFHNASRPLVPKNIYSQGIKMLLQGADAIKQRHVVVDTLKKVDQDFLVVKTVDREKVKALTSPEFYWVDSIVAPSEEFGWFFDIQNKQNRGFIMGELESTRIRSEKDLVLVNALIEQGRLS